MVLNIKESCKYDLETKVYKTSYMGRYYCASPTLDSMTYILGALRPPPPLRI